MGGRTLWADLQAAYDGLSEPLQQLLEPVSAVYDAYPGDGTYSPIEVDLANMFVGQPAVLDLSTGRLVSLN